MYTSLEQFREEKLKAFDAWESALAGEGIKLDKALRIGFHNFLSQAIDEAAEATVEAVVSNQIFSTEGDTPPEDVIRWIEDARKSWLTPTKETNPPSV